MQSRSGYPFSLYIKSVVYHFLRLGEVQVSWSTLPSSSVAQGRARAGNTTAFKRAVTRDEFTHHSTPGPLALRDFQHSVHDSQRPRIMRQSPRYGDAPSLHNTGATRHPPPPPASPSCARAAACTRPGSFHWTFVLNLLLSDWQGHLNVSRIAHYRRLHVYRPTSLLEEL